MSQNLQKAVINTTVWTVLGFGAIQFIRLIGNITLAALLYEEAFALMAICLALQQGLVMFSDLGFHASIVQNKKGDIPRFLNTVWSLQILRGLLLTIILILLASPIADFYADSNPEASQLVGLIYIIALSNMLASLESTKIHIASRELSISRITIFQVTAQILNVGTMLIIAYITESLYSLAIGTVVSSLFLSICSHLFLVGSKNKFEWDWTVFAEVITFGKWIFVSTAIYFLTLQLDKIIFAKIFDLGLVGVYVIALNLALLGEMVVVKLVTSVIFPTFARILNMSGQIQEALKRSRELSFALGAFVTAGLVGCGHSFIHIAYSSNYSAAGVYLPILAAGSWLVIVDSVYSSVLLAHGKSKWLAISNFSKVASFLLLLAPAISMFGFLGAVIAVALSNIARLASTAIGIRTIGFNLSLTEVKYSVWIVISVTITYFIPGVLQENQSDNHIVVFFLQVSIVVIMFVPILIKLPRILREATAK